MGRSGRGHWSTRVPDPADARPISRRTVRRVVHAFRPYRARVSVVGVMIVVTATLGVVNPLLIKVIFDQALFPVTTAGPGGHPVQLPPDLGLLYVLVGLMILIPVISGLIGVGQTYLANVIGQHVMLDFRNELYSHLQAMPIRFYTSTRTGEIQSRLANDVGGVQSVVTDTASSILSNIVIVISTVVAMLILSWQLTLLSLGITPIFLFFTYRVGKARQRVAAVTQQSMAEMSAITQETLSVSGILLAKVFGRQRFEIDRFRAENKRLADLEIRQQMVGRYFFALIQIFFSITPALVYLVAGIVLAHQGAATATIQAGTIVAFTTLQSRLFFPIGQMLQISVEVQSSMALFDRIFEYLDMPYEIFDAPEAVTLPVESVRGGVAFDHVFFRYDPPAQDRDDGAEEGEADATAAAREAADVAAAEGEDEFALTGRSDLATRAQEEAGDEAEGPSRPVWPVRSPDEDGAAGDGTVADNEAPRTWTLEDVSLDIRPGQLAALVGPSGAGKTTITYLVPRLYDVTTGAVQIDGHDVRGTKLESLADAIGMVTQETYLFHDTVRRNLLYGKPDATQDELEAAARAAFIHDRIMEMPEGYDTVVGERGYRLSGGEKQRLAIARVILKDPRILILDEATSSLDTASERLVQEALKPLMRERTTLAIAHRLSTILAADVIFVIERGRVVERGTHDELLAAGGLYARLYEQQFRSGTVEAECEDGVVLTSGQVLHETRSA
jgi:ATP-binding cassette subfamily B protein